MVNDFYIYDENILGDMGKIEHCYDHNSKISKIFLDITNKCNIRCRHCFTDAKNNPNIKELNTDDIKKIINDLVKLNINRLALGGGEPLVRPDIYELIHYGSERGLRIHISSNGLLLTENNIKKLKKCGLNSIQISIDSSIAAQHDYLRNCPGLFDKCLETIKNIKKHRINLLVSTTITKLNINELDDIAKMVKSSGVRLHRFIRFVPVGRGNDSKNMLYVEGEMLSKKVSHLRKKYAKYFFGNPKNYFGIPITTYEDKKYKNNPIGCEAGKLSVDILPNGNVVPCNYLGIDEQWICGNIVDNTLEHIINNSSVLKKFKHLSGKNIAKCFDCLSSKICGKGCRAVAYNLHGAIDALDPCCTKLMGEYENEIRG
jgi:radical SAM protein with 4Fe4S-binding SPASM domain